jgi:hypothetical protein
MHFMQSSAEGFQAQQERTSFLAITDERLNHAKSTEICNVQ